MANKSWYKPDLLGVSLVEYFVTSTCQIVGKCYTEVPRWPADNESGDRWAEYKQDIHQLIMLTQEFCANITDIIQS